jgi:hypothetical protein
MSQADYVVVGAGSAGCALAARLSDDPDHRVVVLEAGGPDSAKLIQQPAFWRRISRLAALFALAALALFAPAARAAVPAADIQKARGPGTPLLAAIDLPRGYTEQEYFLTGTANRYRISDPLATASVVDGGWPYKSRMLVRRPDARHFNGTVIVEWFNVTTGQDIDFVWAATRAELTRQGYAYVGISPQRVGLNHLKNWNPARYGDLTAETGQASDLELEPAGFPYAGGDVLAYDIFGQAVQALRSGAEPLRGLRVKHVIATGESQSAGRLTRYYNAIQPRHDVLDGFLYYDAAGPLRADTGVPATSFESEWRNGTFNPNSQPDTPFLRRWEVAGTSHVGLTELGYIDAVIARDRSLRAPDGTPVTLTNLITGCTSEPLWSDVPNDLVLRAQLALLDRWVSGGSAMPTAPRFAREGTTVLRDAAGEVIGGIRLPQFAAPKAFHLASNPGPGFCTLAGHHRFYTPAEMKSRYGSKARYLLQVGASTWDNVRRGYILPHDALDVLHDAARTRVG